MWGRQKKQASDQFAGSLNEARIASTAGGGTALSTSAAIIGIPNNIGHVEAVVRNFASSAVVAKIALNPCLALLKTTDDKTFVDGTVTGQQNPAGSGFVVDNLPASTGRIYIGAHVPFRGVRVTMGGTVNAVVSTLTNQFWNGTAWTAVSGGSDGTASGGATLAQNGDITFTVPTTWAAAPLTDGIPIFPPVGVQNNSINRRLWTEYAGLPLFWLRLTVSATLTAGTVIATAFSMNRDTTHYAEFLENSLLAFRTEKTIGGIGAIEALTDAGTASLIVNCYADNPTDQF
jgi:hypothetical protein